MKNSAKLFSYALAVLSTSVYSKQIGNGLPAATNADGKERWVFLDLNSQPKEVNTIREIASQRSDVELVVIESTREFESWLKKENNGSEAIDRLFASGHSMGPDFLSGGSDSTGEHFSAESLQRYATEYPSVGAVESFHALGCYVGKRSNMKLWMRATPNLKYFYGFHAAAPSGAGEGMVNYIRSSVEADDNLRNSPPKDQDELLRAASRTGAISPGYFYSSIGMKDDKDANTLFYADDEDTSEEVLVDPNDPACKDAFEALENHLKSKNVSSVDAYLKAYQDPASCTDLPDLSRQSATDLRPIYGYLQDLTSCPQAFYAGGSSGGIRSWFGGGTSNGERVGLHSPEELMVRLKNTLNLILSNHITENVAKCSPDFLKQTSAILDHCVQPKDHNVQSLVAHLDAGSLSRQDVCQLREKFTASASSNPSHADAANIFTAIQHARPDSFSGIDVMEPMSDETMGEVCPRLRLNDPNFQSAYKQIYTSGNCSSTVDTPEKAKLESAVVDGLWHQHHNPVFTGYSTSGSTNTDGSSH